AIKAEGKSAGISLKPGTPAEAIAGALDLADIVLVMSVNPGFGGQEFMPGSLEKIAAIRAMIGKRNVAVSVDGGVSEKNAAAIERAGANVLIAGSSIFKVGQGAYANAIAALRSAAMAAAA